MGPSSKAVRVRKSVLTLGKPGDDLAWYAKAVAVLQARPIKNPTSWRYLAAVHGYPGHNDDPFAKSGESLPSGTEQGRFWNQCQHQSWSFLPWHPGYLAVFEEIVAAAVVQAGGPRGWALPYRSYSEGDAGARELPAAFRDQQDAHGNPNPLWVAGRAMSAAGDQIPAPHVSLAALLDGPRSRRLRDAALPRAYASRNSVFPDTAMAITPARPRFIGRSALARYGPGHGADSCGAGNSFRRCT